MNLLKRWKPEEQWNPFREWEEVQHRMDAMFGLPMRRGSQQDLSFTASEWSPLVDIVEDDKEYLIKAELPELKKEDIKVNVENGVLTLRGERKFEQEEKTKKYHRVERAYGSFARSFTVPDDADGSKVSAEFKDGVLKVHLPKSETAKPKSIDIKAG